MKYIVLVIAALVSFRASAFSYGLAGGGAYTMPAVSGTTSTSKTGIGGGLILEKSLGSGHWGIELDGLFFQRVFGGVGSTLNVFNTIRIPLMLEYFLGRSFALKLGGFYDVLLSPLPTSFTATSDYGASAGLAFYIPFRSLNIVVDGRYNYNLVDISATGTLNPHDVTAVLGLIWGKSGRTK